MSMKTHELLIKHFKDIVIGVLIISVSVFILFWLNSRQEARKYSELIGKYEDYEQIKDSLAKLRVEYKDQKSLISEIEKRFESVRLEKNEKIKALSQAVFDLEKKNRKYVGDDLVSNRRNPYVYNEIRISGDDSPPIAWIMRSEDGTLRSGLYKFDIEVETLKTQDDKTGRIKFYSQANYVLRQDGISNRKDSNLKKWSGIKYPLKIKGGVAYVDPTQESDKKNKFMLALATGLGVDYISSKDENFGARPNLNLSLFGFGKSKTDLKFKFAQFGVGVGESHGVSFDVKPVMWRPFNFMPNTYVGAGVFISSGAGKGATLGVSLNF